MGESVSAIVRVMSRGGGFSSLVETTSGRRFIMKLAGVGQGAAGLRTEFIAVRFAGALGLKVPHVVPLMLGKLPWEVGTDEFDDAIRRSSGWNLGVEFVESARDLTGDDLAEIPAEFLDRLAAVDAFLQNVDRTAQNPNLLLDRKHDYWAIDFGACRFLDRFAQDRQRMTFELPANHFLAGRNVQPLRLDKRSLPLRQIAFDVPDAWLGQGNHETLLTTLGSIVETYVRTSG